MITGSQRKYWRHVFLEGKQSPTFRAVHQRCMGKEYLRSYRPQRHAQRKVTPGVSKKWLWWRAKGNSCQSQPKPAYLPTILWKEWKRMGKGRCYVTSYVLLYKLHASWRLGQTAPTLIIQASHHWRGASCPSHHLSTWYSGLTYPSRALKWA